MRLITGKALDEKVALGKLEVQLNRQCAKVRATPSRNLADSEHRKTLLLGLENIYSKYEVTAVRYGESNRSRRHRRRYLSALRTLREWDQNA